MFVFIRQCFIILHCERKKKLAVYEKVALILSNFFYFFKKLFEVIVLWGYSHCICFGKQKVMQKGNYYSFYKRQKGHAKKLRNAQVQ